MSIKIEQFLRENPVFTRQAFDLAMNGGSPRKNTMKNTLAHHLKQGHIVRIKRGLFASIPYGADAKTYPINPYLVASKLADDAIIGYQTALAFYGISYSASFRFIYLTKTKPKTMEFRGVSYQPSQFPTPLIINKKTDCFVNKADVQGIDIIVTTKERTLVDVMDRPLLGGGWEEIWRSLAMIERLKIENIVEYALMLKNATTIAKVGFYLEQRKIDLKVSNEQLSLLKQHSPHSPQYMEKAKKSKCKLISNWNLMVPESLINQDWNEELNWEPKA